MQARELDTYTLTKYRNTLSNPQSPLGDSSVNMVGRYTELRRLRTTNSSVVQIQLSHYRWVATEFEKEKGPDVTPFLGHKTVKTITKGREMVRLCHGLSN